MLYPKRNILFVIILISNLNNLVAQKVMLYENKRDALYPMMNNSYSFLVPDIPCDALVFKTNNGEIKQYNCKLYYKPDTIKNTVFMVYKKVANKLELIDSIKIKVKENIDHHAMIGVKGGGEISKADIIAFGGMRVLSYYFDGHAVGSSVISYRMTTFRNEMANTTIVNGQKFSDKALELLNSTKEKDKYFFLTLK